MGAQSLKIKTDALARQCADLPDQRDAQLVDAAYILLDEHGLEGLTIRAVLSRTGLARRAFYDRFAGKDDLVLAVFEQTLHLAAEYFAQEIATVADPMERLRIILTGIVLGRSNNIPDSNNKRAAALCREHFRLAEARPAELQRAIAPLIGLIADQISSGQLSGNMRQGSPQKLAMLAYNLVSTTVQTELIRLEGGVRAPNRQQELADDIWSFCSRAILA